MLFTRRSRSERRLALDLGDGAFRFLAGAHGGGSPLSCLGESADAETVRLAVAKLCSDDPDREDERRALACLQASLAASLVALPVDDYFAQVLSPFLPTYGDALVPIDPKPVGHGSVCALGRRSGSIGIVSRILSLRNRQYLAFSQRVLAECVFLPVCTKLERAIAPAVPTTEKSALCGAHPPVAQVLVSERRPPSASSSLSVLVGVVRGEGERWLARFLDASTNGSWAAHFTPDQYRSTASAVFTFAFGEEILEAESLRTDLESLNDGARVFRRYGTLLDDALFVCPALQFADYLSDAAHVRLYELASAEQASQAARQHGEDSDAAHDWGPDDILAQPGTRAFADAVLAFIATGSADWPLYTRTEPVSRYFSRNQTITRKTDAIRTCKPRFECYPGKTRFE
ncbi:uncharacterized protein LOC144180089 [Haemaphysalis longicornis]